MTDVSSGSRLTFQEWNKRTNQCAHMLRAFGVKKEDKVATWCFNQLPKPIEWLSFLHHDLPVQMDISEEVRKLAIQNGLSRAQIMALETLKSASSEEYQKVMAHSKGSSSSEVGPGRKEAAQIELKEP